MKRLAFLAFFLFGVLFNATVFFNATVASALTIDEFLGDGVVSSSIVNTPASLSTANTSAIGGSRFLYSIKTSSGAGTARLETFPDPDFGGDTDYSVGYTQGAHSGQGIVTWDGDSSASLTPNGLAINGVDFLQDGGTEVQLSIKFFDFPANVPIDITLRLYDSNGVSGLKYSDFTVTLNKSTLNQATQVNEPFLISVPYSRFTTSGLSTITAPGNSTFNTNTVFGPSGAVDMAKVGAIQLIVNGLTNTNAPDLTLDFIKTNGVCTGVPDVNGKVIDDCGVCIGQPNYNAPKDSCGLCASNPAYQNSTDSCGICMGQPGYQTSQDSCGLCPSAPNYNKAKDPCGVCFGNGTSCADCSGTANGTKKVDICGVCDGLGTTCLDCSGIPFGTKAIDSCGICGGTISDPLRCNTVECVTVQATSDILAFEKRLVSQAKTISKKYFEEDGRNKRNNCKINSKPSTIRVKNAYETITAAGKDIFTKGVSICGDNCVTVSFAEQVQALAPTLKIIQSETSSLANKVKKCYIKKKIKTIKGSAGVATTIKTIDSELKQLIKDCKDKKVCPH